MKTIKIINGKDEDKTFIIETNSIKKFEEIKKYNCYFRVSKLVWEDEEIVISNFPNDSEVDYILDLTDQYEKVLEDEAVFKLLMQVNGAEKYIKESSKYLDVYGN